MAAKRPPARNTDEDRSVRQVPTVRPDPSPRPHVAGAGDHTPARLVQRRPARRQPGADRADGRRAQAPDVPPAREDGLQGNRDRLSGGVADRLRLRAQADRGQPDPRRRQRAGADAGAGAADRAHVRGAEGRQARDHAPVQLHVDDAAARRVPARPRGRAPDRRRRGGGRARRRARAARHRMDVPVFARKLHRHRTRLREGGLRRRARRVAAHAGPQGDHQPAGHGGDGHAQRVRRPDRVDAPEPRRAATASCCPCIRTTIAAAAWPPPNLP